METKLKVERIENLEELKAIHRSIYADAVNLRSELDKAMPSILNIEAFAKSIHMNALKAKDFDFFLVQRTIKEMPCKFGCPFATEEKGVGQGVIVDEKKYINQDIPQVTVSFQLSSPDWNLLKTTPQWAWVQQQILESQKGYSQRYR